MDFDFKPRSNLPSSSPPRRPNIRMNVRGSGALIMAKDTGRLLFALRASRSVSYEKPREWNLWGGKVYLHESPETGAIRCAKEQTGYKGNFADVIQLYSFVSLYTNFRYYTYLLIVENEFEPNIDRKIIDHYQWVEYGEFPEPLHPAVKTLFERAGHKIKDIIEKNILKESLSVGTFPTIKLKDLIKELW
jgi:ADP-ribose pyrophosphatase YjhB (NUDIX family)